MKTTLFLVLVTISQIFATGTYSQNVKINIDLKNTTIKKVLANIENKSEFLFMYDATKINVAQKVNISANNKHITEVLDELFKDKNIIYSINNRIVALKNTNSSMQQKNSITGKVTDENGGPLPGVTVLLKGTTTGTITDINGNYSMQNIQENAVLVFSFIGMKNIELSVAGKSEINVSMVTSAIGIDEVVAIGYGTQKKASVTGSISSITGEVLEQSPSPNLTNALAGQMSGVIANVRDGEPGLDDADILIRGKGTLNDNSALIIIDGIPDRGGFSRLNPDDIESFTVLKDASAAIYGARAANGVILIKTKRGKIEAPKLSVSSSVGYSQPTRLPHFLDSYKYAVAENEYRTTFGGLSARWSDDDLEKFRTGSSPLTHPNVDWMDIMFRDWSLQHNENLSLRGGNDRVKYFVSGQNLYQDSNFSDGSNYNQYQYRTNLDIKVTDYLTMSIDLSYRLEDRHLRAIPETNDLWSRLKEYYPYLISYYPNGLPGLGMEVGENISVLSSSKAGYNREKTNVYNTKIDFKYDLSKLTKGLYIQGYAAMDRSNEDNKTFKNVWNEYNYNEDTEEYDEYETTHVRTLTVYKSNSLSTTLHARIGYANTFNDHEISGFIAAEQNQSNGDYVSAYRDNFISDEIDELFAGDDGDDLTNDGSSWKTARANYFGRVHYGYKEKYLADFTLRYDGSQNFPKDKRFGTFPGASVAWRISEEPFFIADFVDYLKIRASWGQMGNDNVDAFQYLSTYSYGVSGEWINEVPMFGEDGSFVKNLIANQTPNTNITWETATTMNIGFDSKMFGNKLSINAEAFYSKRKGILISRDASVPQYSGLSLPEENLGKVNNKGIEFELSYNDKIGGEFKYYAKGNFTFARNKVIYTDEPESTPDIQKEEGYPIDSWILYQSDGLFQTQDEIDDTPVLSTLTGPGDVNLVDVNGDGALTDLDKKRISSSTTPEIMYGLTLGGSYKGFELSVFFQGQARAFRMVTPGALNVYPEFFDDRWQKEGDNKYPRTFYGPTTTDGQSAESSDFWLKSAAFVRLKNVELSYSLPKTIINPVGFDRIKVFVSASNLFTIDHIKLFDPELITNGASYPLERIVRLGVNLTL